MRKEATYWRELSKIRKPETLEKMKNLEYLNVNYEEIEKQAVTKKNYQYYHNFGICRIRSYYPPLI